MENDNNIENENIENGNKPATPVVRRIIRRAEPQTTEIKRVVTQRPTFVRKTTNATAPVTPAPVKTVKAEEEDYENVSSFQHRTVTSFTASVVEKKVCKYNKIVLVGMPCSGKTSIGRSLASLCDYEFYDMDEYIEKMSGKTIPEIFAEEDGENKFRALETQCAEELGKMDHVVIATGGGAVTREETMQNLNLKEGYTIFIHREFYKIATTPQRVMDKRPLFENTSFEALLKTYKTRLPLYRKYSDIEIENDKNREDAVVRIKDKLFD